MDHAATAIRNLEIALGLGMRPETIAMAIDNLIHARLLEKELEQIKGKK